MNNKLCSFVEDLLVIKETDFAIIKNIKSFITNNRELVLYIIVGASTTFLNLIIYFVLLYCFDNFYSFNIPNWQIAELIAFIIAVIYSFAMDKYVVFMSPFKSVIRLLFEFGQFVLTRLLSESLAALIMHILIDLNGANAYIVKVLVMIMIIVVNYITSKFIIFRK